MRSLDLMREVLGILAGVVKVQLHFAKVFQRVIVIHRLVT